MRSLAKRFGKLTSRQNKRTSRVQISLESLESRTMMAGLLGDIDVVAHASDDARDEVCESRSESAWVDQRALRAAQDNQVAIDPQPAPHPRMADAVFRAEIASESASVERAVDLETLAATSLQRHAANANDYVMGMGWSADESDDPMGIDPLPTPHPRPEAAVEYVGLIPVPSGRPRAETELELAGWIPEPTAQPRPEDAIERVGLIPIPSGRPRPETEVARTKLEPNPVPSPCSEAAHGDDNPVGIAPLPSPHPRPEAKVGQAAIEPNPLPRPIQTVLAARGMTWGGRAF